MEVRRDVFQAIADPTRRQIIELLMQRSLNVNTLAENFDVSRQAVSVHVKILSECGLLIIKKQGRERYCEANPDKLDEVAEWVNYCRRFWTKQFNSLDRYLKNIKSDQKRKNEPPAKKRKS